MDLYDENDFRSKLFRKIEIINSKMLKMMQPLVKKIGLTHQSVTILFMIYTKGNCNITCLNKKLGLNQGNLSSLCKRLEQQGYLIRKREANDERVVNLYLSDKGQETVLLLKQELDVIEKKLDYIPQEKKDLVLQGLDTYYEILCELEKGD